jgi:hypothetical protein
MGKFQVHQIDGNQREIFDYLQAHGFTVISIGRPLDALAGKDGKNYLIEIKRPKAKLRPSQEKFLASWRGHAAVIRDLSDAKALIDRHHGRTP